MLQNLLFHDRSDDEAPKWTKTMVELAGTAKCEIGECDLSKVTMGVPIFEITIFLPFALQKEMAGKAKVLGVEGKEYTLDLWSFFAP